MKTITNRLVHPVVIGLIIAISVFLWMPFGVGYSEWPWGSKFWRAMIQIICLSFIIISALATIMNLCPYIRSVRLCFSILALLVSLYGILALYSWKDSHLDYLERIGHKVER